MTMDAVLEKSGAQRVASAEVAREAKVATASNTDAAELENAARKAQRRRKTRVLAWRLVVLAALLGGWELSGRLQWIDPFFYSTPSAVAARLYEWMTEGTAQGSLWWQLYVTMEEALLGFVTGSVMGVVLGIALGRNRFAADVFWVYIKVANAIPRVVLAPVFILIFGLGLWSKVALSFVMVFFVVFSNAFQGVREADRALIANAQILGASHWQITRSVVLPSAMSWIFASLHVSFGFAIIGAIVGEFVGSREGIGLLIQVASGSFDAAGIFAAIVLIVAIALIAEYAMTAVENRLLKWRPTPFHDLNG
jgi:NitT/TauT family transport system permease protein